LKGGWVYILASRYRGTLYIGVTADIARRSWQHREGIGSGFTKRYEVHRLVYAEEYPTIAEAIAREKALKKWRRDWKIELVEKANPDWDDLFDRLSG
jgi:putative endonuclease